MKAKKHKPKFEFRTLIRRGRLDETMMSAGVGGEFFDAFSKAIFDREMTTSYASYPLPENFALLLSRTHLAQKFMLATNTAQPGRQFKIFVQLFS